MELPAIVTALAIVEYLFFSFKVGLGRQTYEVHPPATTGHPEWERMYRVQQNTVEQLIIFVPALWMFATFIGPTLAAVIGLGFLIGRPIYYVTYVKDPETRTPGFLIGYVTNVILLLGGLGGAIYALL